MTGQAFLVHAELALAQHDPERALTLMDDVIESVGRMGLLVLLPSALHVKARAVWTLGRVDEARAMLVDAGARARAMQTRYRLLPIPMSLRKLEIALGHPMEAEAVRLEASEVATCIAEHAPVELRTSFLSLPPVRVVMGA